MGHKHEGLSCEMGEGNAPQGFVKNFILKIGGHLSAGGTPASNQTRYVNWI